MYELVCSASIDAPVTAVWDAWSDLAAYPSWDPREEVMRLDGPVAAGTTGFSKQAGPRPGAPIRIKRVDVPTRFTIETPLPGGRLVLDHVLEAAPDGGTTIHKRYEAWGPMSVAFRLVFARGIRAQMPDTFRALGAEVARRASIEG
jgi:uncharacterized protein YndB with AHSA1/START domain